MLKRAFEIGNRVKVRGFYTISAMRGATGRIVSVNGDFGVIMDKPFPSHTHDLDGDAPNGNGRWFPMSSLELIDLEWDE